jgi:catechol 2,3-dioxygenase-like lactoylglutathione lyase family enzyme
MPICSGPIVQTAWVTDDLAQTESHLSDHFGAGHWTRFEGIVFGPDTCEYRGRPAEFAADISLTYLGDMQLELIQPLTGESIYHDFLARAGAGLHHICFETNDMAATLARAAAAGVAVAQRGSMAGMMEFAYLDGAAAGVPFVEVACFSDEMRQIFDDIRRKAV